jgi:hypothetical protein
LAFIIRIYHDARSSECQILRMNIRCLCVWEDEIPMLWEPTIPLMAITSPFGADRCPRTLAAVRNQFFFISAQMFKLLCLLHMHSLLTTLPSTSASVLHCLHHTFASRTRGAAKKTSKWQIPSPHNKFSLSHYNHIAYYFTFVHLRNHIRPSVLFWGKLCNKRAHLFTTLSDLKLVHVRAAKTHLSDTVLPFKLAEPNKNTSECHE